MADDKNKTPEGIERVEADHRTKTGPAVDEHLNQTGKELAEKQAQAEKEQRAIEMDLKAQSEYEAEVALERQARQDKAEKDREKADKAAEKHVPKPVKVFKVVEKDRDYDTTRHVIDQFDSKEDAESLCELLDRTADPLSAVRFEVEEGEEVR